MRKGGGKSKGGAYEHTVAKKIAEAFSMFGIHEDDCYRTKNSGATKAQPGDLQLSPALSKLLPATIEAKHYRTIKYQLGKPISSQPKSYEIKAWWIQVKKEQRAAKNKFGLLVMRQNNCPDICCFSPAKLNAVFRSRKLADIGFRRYTFEYSIIITRFGSDELWIVSLQSFLDYYTWHLKWFTYGGNL